MKKSILFFFTACLCLAPAQTKSFIGVITDQMCGMDHKMMNVTPDTKCVTECVKMGSKYVLADGKNVYELSDQQTPAKFAAQKVKVSGTLTGKVITVKSIEAAK
ncbi:MAG: hypothetical protein JWO80_2797 [Bryobacterales bacterium]|nr:hypothetical protein [Bryobacterales bacterium]